MVIQRTYDIIIYGATSYTAKFIIKHFVSENYNIALAARDSSKIENSSFPKINCEIENIDKLTKNTKILLNCVGPYIFTGEVIVESCIKNKTHYLDISGEPMFVNLIREKYNEEARRCSIYVITCCGFDSVPADVGTELFKKEVLGDIVIESTISVINPVCNKATWVSLIHSLGNYVKPPTNSKKPKRKEYKWSESLKKYKVIFRGIDHSVVKTTQKLVAECGGRSVEYVAYIEIGGLYKLFIYFIYVFMICLISKFSFGRNLLIKYYKFFSKGIVAENPNNDILERSNFNMTFKTLNNNRDVFKSLMISGPDPALNTTGICASQCALSLLELLNEPERRSHMKLITGGVVTPGFIFKNSNLITRLKSKGITIEFN